MSTVKKRERLAASMTIMPFTQGEEIEYCVSGQVWIDIDFGDKDYRAKVMAQAENLISALEKVGIDKKFAYSSSES